MYDSETDSWWAQASGKAIDGRLKDSGLEMYPSSMMTWAEWRNLHPNTLVLAKMTQRGLQGMSPGYTDYHQSSRVGVTGRLRVNDNRLPLKSLVVGFRIDGEPIAVELERLKTLEEVTGTSRSGKQFQVVATPQGGGAQVFLAGSSASLRTEIPSSLSYWFAWRAFFPATLLIEP